MDKQGKINLIALIILTGFSAAVFYHYVLGAYLGLGYPYNTFLFNPQDKFMDFIWTHRWATSIPYESPYAIARSNFSQFPLWYVIALVFAPFDERVATFGFLFVLVVSFVLICQINLRTNRKTSAYINLFIFAFLSFPFLIVIDRANFDFLAFTLSYLFVFLYHKYPRFSLVFLLLAIALKPPCAVFLVLLLADKRYKEIIFTCLLVTGLTLICYQVLPGGLSQNVKGHLNSLGLFNQDYAIGESGLAFGNSLFGVIKFLAAWVNPNIPSRPLFVSLMTPYLLITAVVFFGLGGYIIIIEKEFWKRVALLVFAMCLLPYVSGDYKMLYVFIPMFLFFSENEKDGLDWVYTILFGLLLIPKDYYHLPVQPVVSISVLINPLLMLYFTILIITSGLARFFQNRLRGKSMQGV